ncbi:MAG: MerR family transcriptional regulator [Bacteroidota bacterium]
MAIYSIKDLEKLSGIKAHTIRIWEQRYSIIEPGRTQTNIRYYTDQDLKLLLNIALLNKNGIKISKIAKMRDEEILEKVAAISEINFENDVQLDALTLSMIEMDEYKFDRIVSTNIQQLGFERTMLEVIYPFLDKLGLLWLTGSINPVQENFMSYLIRQKIIAAINNEPIAQGKDVPKFLIYLPEGESQELSLLFMHYLLKSRKFKVVYIGNYISLTDLKDAYQIHVPEYIYAIISETFTKPSVKDYINTLCNTFPEPKILLSGYQVISQNVQSSRNCKVLKNLGDTIQFLDDLSKR